MRFLEQVKMFAEVSFATNDIWNILYKAVQNARVYESDNESQ